VPIEHASTLPRDQRQATGVETWALKLRAPELGGGFEASLAIHIGQRKADGYRHARADTSVRRKEQLQQEVRQIIQNMQGDGTFPTIKQVRIMLSQRSNWAEVSTAVATVRKEFRAIT
jgi:hypothetical protein